MIAASRVCSAAPALRFAQTRKYNIAGGNGAATLVREAKINGAVTGAEIFAVNKSPFNEKTDQETASPSQKQLKDFMLKRGRIDSETKARSKHARA